MHYYCPKGIESWCPYQSAITAGKPLPNHPNYISAECVTMILKLFADFQLNKEDFIKKISSGITSKNIEAIQSFIQNDKKDRSMWN